MSSLEQLNVARYRNEMVEDVDHLVKKYCRIMAWEIPDLDEQAARALILKVLEDALSDTRK